MSVDQARRRQLFERLAATLGPDEATTMFDLLPPAGEDLATRADLALRFADVDRRFAEVDQRFEQVDQRFEQVDRRFEQVDQRFEQVDRRFEQVDQRFDAIEGELREMRADVRALRGEITTAIAGQPRALVLGVITATVSIGGLTAAFAQLF